MRAYLFLSLTIVSEVIATLMLKHTNEFGDIIPSLVGIAGYTIAFYFLTFTLKYMSVGVVYAMWSGILPLLTIFCLKSN